MTVTVHNHSEAADGEAAPTVSACAAKQTESLAAAVQFLTRVRVPGVTHLSTDQYAKRLQQGVVFFPLVGGCIGIFTSVFLLGFQWGLAIWIAAFMALGVEAVLTGAFHEDAWADSWDALGGGWSSEQVLNILKDSRLGTYGTLSLTIGIVVRAACFVDLVRQGWVWAVASIVAAAAIGRIAIVAMMVTTSPILSRKSHAVDLSGTQTWRTLSLGVLFSMPLWVSWMWLGGIQALVILGLTSCLLFGFRRYILYRVGGTTGDLLGCSAYLVQLAVLIGSVWSTPR